MQKCLVLLGGISDHAYMKQQLTQVPTVYKQLMNKYGATHIHEINYQPIMDKHAILAKSLLDPARLVINPDGWKAQSYVECEMKRLCSIYDQVDVISHSLGSWMILKCDVKINSLHLIASPIGFSTFIARNIVQMNVGTPKIKCKNLYYSYSSNDLVSCFPPAIQGKWKLGSTYCEVRNTGTPHDFTRYLIYLNGKSLQFLTNSI